MQKQIKVKLRKDPYGEISDCIFDSIMGGINKYLKYKDPKKAHDYESMRERIHQYVMCDLAELIDWDASK